MLTWGYSRMVRDRDTESRTKIDRFLDPDVQQVIDDPDLPASMQGVRPPDWWAEQGASGTFRADVG